MEDILAKVLFVPEFSAYHESIQALTYIGKGAPPNFTFKKINSPIPKSKILIRINAAALSPLDLQLMNTPISFTSPGQKGIGRDFCGVVEEVGKDQKAKWKIGEKVCGMFVHINGQGTVADHVLINPDVDHIIKAPPNLSTEEAAAFPLSFGAAYRAMSYAKLDDKAWVCILGGNTSTGQFAIQLARAHFNVDKIVTTASSKSDAFVRELGADMVIDYKSATNVGDSLKYVLGQKKLESQEFMPSGNMTHASQEAGGKKFRLILDCVGGTNVLFQAQSILEPYSAGSAYVTLVGDIPMSPKLVYNAGGWNIGRKLMAATGLSGINYIHESVVPGDWLDKAYDLFLNGTIKVTIDSVYEWSDWKKAIEKLETQKTRGKIVLKISPVTGTV